MSTPAADILLPAVDPSPAFHLAQVNVARLVAPLESRRLAAFVEALDPVNEAADRAPGFVWRLQTEEGNATSVEAFSWDRGESVGVIVNLSVWRDLETLHDYVYGETHRAVLRRRREWFVPVQEAYTACWWVPAGHRPTTSQAEDRVLHLREHGPTGYAFPPRRPFPPPTVAVDGHVPAVHA